MSGCQDPLGADQGSTAQILVQRVDQSHLPAPFTRSTVLATDHPSGPVRALDTTHVLVGDGVLQGGPEILDCQRLKVAGLQGVVRGRVVPGRGIDDGVLLVVDSFKGNFPLLDGSLGSATRSLLFALEDVGESSIA